MNFSTSEVLIKPSNSSFVSKEQILIFDRGQLRNDLINKTLSVNAGTVRADFNDFRGAVDWQIGKIRASIILELQRAPLNLITDNRINRLMGSSYSNFTNSKLVHHNSLVHLLMCINWLLKSVSLCPNVIPLSGAYCITLVEELIKLVVNQFIV
jgi:hypothetical protein